MIVVIDASALLGFPQDDPGGDQVEAVLSKPVIFSVNGAEVMHKSVEADVLIDGMREDLDCLNLGIRLQAPVLTADQIWTTLKLPITVHSIRSPI
ncbi:PIN domain nuclease, a component of toxin-antitoxin system (PIN domain) [Nitrosomonas aestuarii]|uniref:PIN domain nuclease, a component of toxin-antitoxin system (PIN domain) n=1 Tax=Nitrosomonas aestuarii TaxID=52441 RepID=A0A1I4DAS3_9PROT|nr:hypothetical protein [Nitrosomonas aestuarii]SFK89226.1 PIN domain nuclease, a component of toxin-antitoxin system (PIN domain) [Nitrosomonas aestuarii]